MTGSIVVTGESASMAPSFSRSNLQTQDISNPSGLRRGSDPPGIPKLIRGERDGIVVAADGALGHAVAEIHQPLVESARHRGEPGGGPGERVRPVRGHL